MRAHISKEQRMERIGELLSKGVAIMLANENRDASAAAAPIRKVNLVNLDATSRNILTFVQKVGCASPREIEHRLGIGRRTVLRKLKSMYESDILIKKGKTTSIRYELSDGIVLRH